MHFRAIDERPFTVPQPGAPWLLLGFAALSLLLHSLLFISNDDAVPLNINQLGSLYIHTILSNEPAATAKSDQAPNTDRPSEKPPAAEIRKARHNAPEPDNIKAVSSQRQTASVHETIVPPPTNIDTAKQTVSVTKSHIEKSTASTTQMNTAAQRNYLLGQLQDQLSRYLIYPLRARRRGWEGEVLLSLRLDTEGQLHDIQLLHSSGYALLDRSALKALSRIERLRLPPSAPSLQPTHLQLPVIYRLSES